MAILSTKAGATKLLHMNTAYTPTATVALAALSSTDDAAIYTATTKAYGVLVPFENVKNRRLLVVIENTAESGNADVYVKAGTNQVAGALSDLKVTVAHGAKAYIELDTGKFGHLEGAYKGNLVVVGAAASIKVGYVELV